MDNKQKIFTAGIIGLGFIGAGDQVSGDAIGQKVSNLDGTHAQALFNHPGVHLIAGASRDEGRRKRFEERYEGVKTYADWRKMIETEKLDIVSIATNSPYHAEITVACAEAGIKAIFCEKPISTRLSDADNAVKACRNHGAILVINHCRRWHPLWRAVRDEIHAGAIGEIYYAAAHWPTGRLGNVGTHIFDALHMILDLKAEAVSGVLDDLVYPDCRGPQYRDPGGWGVIAFPGGIKAFIDAPQAAKLPLGIRIVGSAGDLAISGNTAVVEPRQGNARTISAPESKFTSMDLAVQDIVRCLIDVGKPASTGEDGVAALEVIIGFHISDRLRGQWVQLPIKGEDRELEVPIG